MAEVQPTLPPRMEKIVEMFGKVEGRDKLELLLDYSASMPKVPDALKGKHEELEAVHECATPLFVHAELKDGKMAYAFDVPEVSPTVRGFAAILGLGLKDATPEQVLTTPGDLFFQMGLHKVLTPQRLNGSAALLGHMKRLAIREMEKRVGSSGVRGAKFEQNRPYFELPPANPEPRTPNLPTARTPS